MLIDSEKLKAELRSRSKRIRDGFSACDYTTALCRAYDMAIDYITEQEMEEKRKPDFEAAGDCAIMWHSEKYTASEIEGYINQVLATMRKLEDQEAEERKADDSQIYAANVAPEGMN